MYYISVLFHVIAAAIWVGGMIFLPAVLLPAIRNNPQKIELIHTVGLKFRTIGWIVLFILLVTGLSNMYYRQVDFSWAGLTVNHFGRMVLLKLLVFTATVTISSLHDFYIGTTATRLWMQNADDKKTRNFRLWARWAGRINMLLGITAFGIGVAMVRGIY
ncbi:MAG: hypothetical protein POELPBGB_01121 [Bacteroidia bacterium]|nr:hypothetical protein [Bacteroidia bacterium]